MVSFFRLFWGQGIPLPYLIIPQLLQISGRNLLDGRFGGQSVEKKLQMYYIIVRKQCFAGIFYWSYWGVDFLVKIIVADDEKWVRNTITSIIPYEKLGLTLISEAENGLEALEICRQYKPDILITDLMMPGITGMDLIQELKTLQPDLKIIIISGYSDFEYAKTAIKYGVSEYILKPIDENELCNILARVRDEILEKRRREEEETALRSQYKRALPIICTNYLNQLIQPNSFITDNINKTLQDYGIDFRCPCYTAAVFSPDNSTALADRDNLNLYRTLIRRTVKRYLKGVAFPRLTNEFEMVAIINHRQVDDSANLFSKGFHLCISLYKKHFGDTLSIGVSSPAQYISKLPELYAQACKALEVRFWKSGPKIFYFQENRLTDIKSIDIPEQDLENAAMAIKLKDLQPAYRLVNEVCSFIKSNYQYVNPAPVKELFWTLIQSLASFLNIQMSFIEYESMITNAHPYETIRNINSLDRLVQYAKEVIKRLHEHFENKNNYCQQINPIEMAKQIINRNYQSDINLELISKYVHLSPTYFSELFKRETGMSFIDYKTLVRIENAKKLFANTGMSIYEISNRIGYTNPKYFSRLFKKITGMSPFEYKEKYCRPNPAPTAVEMAEEANIN